MDRAPAPRFNTEPTMPRLFDPIQAGDLELPNRIIMAPLTRSRAGASRIANHLMAKYYSQRASAGVIIFFIASLLKDTVDRIGDFLDSGKSDWRA